MKKYRIIEIKKANDVYYLLQVKNWFFWETEYDSEFYYNKVFETKEEAKAFYIKWYTIPTRTIVETG